MLRAGFSVVDITPAPGLRMEGMPNPPAGEGIRWPLCGRTAVFDDGIRQAAIVSLDLLFLMPSVVAEMRQAITAGTPLAPEHVMIACTHTHRAPYVTAFMDDDTVFSYLDFVRARLVEGMARAISIRRPVRLRAAGVDVPGWTFNRRQIYRTDMGEQVGTQGPETVKHFVRREGPEDNELQVLAAQDLAGNGVGGLVNFACHTTVMGSEPVYSADYPGPLVGTLEDQLGGTFAFLQGAAGNLWAHDMSVENPSLRGGAEHATRMAEALAARAADALADGGEMADPRVGVARRILRLPQRRPTAEQVALAKWYLEEAPDDVDSDEFIRKLYGHPYTFYNNGAFADEWFSREIIGMWEWQRRTGTRELLEDVEVQAISVGDVAFVGYPAEYFTEFGLKTKANSPFANTFVVELANGWHGYVPTVEAFDHGGYEPRLGYQSRLIPEAGDAMCDAGIALLRQLDKLK